MPKSRELARSAGRRVRFEVRLPQADEVALTGDFSAWNPEGIPLHHDGGETWYTVLELPTGEYQYRLRVDGEWRDDPSGARRGPNPYGTENGVLIVP